MPINISINDMDRFEKKKKEMKKIRPIKRNWYDMT